MTFPLKFVFSTVMYFSAKRRFNPGASDSQLSGENSNELLFMVGTPNKFSLPSPITGGFLYEMKEVMENERKTKTLR